MVYIVITGGGADASTFPPPPVITFHPLYLITMNLTIPTNEQLGAQLRRYAKISATVIVFAFVILEGLFYLTRDGITNFAKIAYDSGYALGKFVHELNDKLAEIAVRLNERPMDTITELVMTKTAAILSAFDNKTPAPAFYHPLAEIASELEQLTVPQLRNILKTKVKAKKQQLIALALAW
jgi:hypothetical protein